MSIEYQQCALLLTEDNAKGAMRDISKLSTWVPNLPIIFGRILPSLPFPPLGNPHIHEARHEIDNRAWRHQSGTLTFKLHPRYHKARSAQRIHSIIFDDIWHCSFKPASIKVMSSSLKKTRHCIEKAIRYVLLLCQTRIAILGLTTKENVAVHDYSQMPESQVNAD